MRKSIKAEVQGVRCKAQVMVQGTRYGARYDTRHGAKHGAGCCIRYGTRCIASCRARHGALIMAWHFNNSTAL